MRIQKIIWQNRRDFKAIYECEFCGDTGEGNGYDDSHFHDSVIPNLRCRKCDKKSGTATSQATNPDYMQY